MPHVLILTEAGPEYGYGHLGRCVAMAHGLREAGLDVEFRLEGTAPKGFLGPFAQQKGGWHSGPEGDYSPAFSPLRWLVVDSYRATLPVLAQWAECAPNVLFLDDDHRLAYPPGHWVLNYAPTARPEHYPDAQRVLAGLAYAPLRPTFWAAAVRTRFPDAIQHAMLTLGGMPNPDLHNRLMAAIQKAMPKATLHVLLGSTPADTLAPPARLNVVLHPPLDETQMAALMQQCDIAITAGGTTLLELCATRTPAAAIATAPNQLPMLDYLVAKGAMTALPNPTEPEFLMRASSALGSALSLTRRRRMADNMARHGPDGHGALRIAALLKGHLDPVSLV